MRSGASGPNGGLREATGLPKKKGKVGKSGTNERKELGISRRQRP